MTGSGCEVVRFSLGEFVDRELPGSAMLEIAQHVKACDDCAREVQTLRELGDTLRSAAANVPHADGLYGLAGGVLSRYKAEQAHSWLAVFRRGFEDWHWTIVGAGAVTAAFISVLFVSMILQFGPAPERDDSLAGTLNSLASSPGTLFLLTAGDVVQFDDGASQGSSPSVMPAGFAMPSESDLVAKLNASLVSKDGHIVDMATMSDSDRRQAEALLDQIKGLRMSAPRSAADPIQIHQIGLVASFSVSAKAL